MDYFVQRIHRMLNNQLAGTLHMALDYYRMILILVYFFDTLYVQLL